VDKLKELISMCKCGVFLTINEHRDYYQTAAETIKEILEHEHIDEEDLPRDIQEKMIETDTIINVHVYPDTPIGFYDIYDYDLDRAIDRALQAVKEEHKNGGGGN